MINGGMSFLKTVTYIKCTDCGLVREKIGSLKEMGILDGNNCPNCGGEVVLLNKIF
jgi:DNA-directed RNA polymerase subunit RPC12/RpoP